MFIIPYLRIEGFNNNNNVEKCHLNIKAVSLPIISFDVFVCCCLDSSLFVAYTVDVYRIHPRIWQGSRSKEKILIL